jgi:hypothetical protein
MGYKTTSAERSQATSAISSAIAAFNNPDGSGFALTSTALTEGVGLKQYTIIPGTNPVNSETSIGGAVITAVAITDSNYTAIDDTALATTGGYIISIHLFILIPFMWFFTFTPSPVTGPPD